MSRQARQRAQQSHRQTAEYGEQGERKMEPIWDIVSGLAKALTEARDQIATLMNQHKSAGRYPPSGRTPSPSHHSRSPSPRGHNSYAHNQCPPRNRPPYYTGQNSTRNVHRSHAHGYCAFGRNTEFKEMMHHSRRGRRMVSPRYEDQFKTPYYTSAGVRPRTTAKENPEGKGGAYGMRMQGANGAASITMVPGSNSFSLERDKSRKGIHLTAKMKDCRMDLDADEKKFGVDNPVKIHFRAPTSVRKPHSRNASPEVRRYCVGTQFANLLKQEALNLREQRIAQELKIRKENWDQ